MNLLEQFNWLVDHGVITIAEENSKNLFEYNMFRSFKADLEGGADQDERINELIDEIETLKSNLDDLSYHCEQLKN